MNFNSIRRQRKSDRIASIVGDSFAVHKNERSLMAAMIDELSKGTRWRQDALECIKGCYPQYFDGKEPEILSRGDSMNL